jgi:hypothetical protein
MEGRAPRALTSSLGVARLRPPLKLVVPVENIEFALIEPVFCALDMAVTHWVVLHIFPFFGVRFSAPQLPVPEISLPKRQLISMPCSRDVIFPKSDPILKRAWRKRIRRAEQMNVIWHDDVAADTPGVGGLPCRDDSLRRFVVCEQRSSPVRAHG